MPITEGGRFTPNDRIVSPGVFSRENDLSGIAQGVADIGGVVVAPFAKGPGFSPTLCRNVYELETWFGTADGTLYGPYTAKQYLQEKGFVTVCRVGALTGYHQRYPWVIWAEQGEWVRSADSGWLDPANSHFVSTASFSLSAASTSSAMPSPDKFTLYTKTATHAITSSYFAPQTTITSSTYLSSSIATSSLDYDSEVTQSATNYYYAPTYLVTASFGPAEVHVTLMPGNASGDITYIGTDNVRPNISGSPATFDEISGSIPHSGSVLYAGTTIDGYISGVFYYSGSVNALTASVTTSSLLNQLFVDHLVKGGVTLSTLSGSTFYSTQAPFDNSRFDITSNDGDPGVQISQSLDYCNQLTLKLFGFLTGSFGSYTTTFIRGTDVNFDPCTGEWAGSGSAFKVLAVLADTQFGGLDTTLHAPGFLGSTQSYNPGPSGTTILQEFDLQLTQSEDGGYGNYHFSLDANDIKYITNVFGDDPTAGNPNTYAEGTKKEAAYLYKIFEDDITAVVADPTHWKVNGDPMPSASWNGEPLNFTDQWSLDLLNGDSAYGLTCAYTPWVISQKISPWNGGVSTRFPLFKVWTLADGTYTNTLVKIEISNVKLAGTVAGQDWGSFTLTVRQYSDTDKKTKILEQFNNLNLDPTSANFVARRIGDRYNYIRYDGKIIEFGTYDNLSKYIRIEANTTNPYPISAVPYGFEAYAVPVNGAIGEWCNPMAYTKASIYDTFPGRYPSGIDFNGPPSGADDELTSLYPTSSTGEDHWRDNLQYFAPVPAGASTGTNTLFALDEEITVNGLGTGSHLAPSLTGSVPAIYDASNETTYVKMRKFVFGFQGGFDGQSPAIPLNIGADITPGNTQGLNCATSTTAGSIAYRQCIGALGNADEFDINLIVTPGIIYSLHSYVTNLTVEMCETRGDCFYILDLYQDDGNPAAGQIDEVVNLASEFDTSYAGTYYPWIKIKDTNINQIVTIPPSVIMPAVYAANDRVAAEWWAAAGLNRGGITQAVQVTDRTTHTERDTLYEGRVNPIAAFPGQGIVAWGQKTLQVESSALDRINVRRLLIEIKKFFASTGRFLVFEQNTAQTRNKFLAIVNPYLEGIQQRSGLYAFQVVMDDTNNTPDLIDRNILYGQIYLKPTKAAEFIIFDFNIMATGATFPTA